MNLEKLTKQLIEIESISPNDAGCFDIVTFNAEYVCAVLYFEMFSESWIFSNTLWQDS